MTFTICRWLFLLLIASLPLVRPFETSIFGLSVPPTDFIFLGVIVFWLVALARGESRFEWSRFYIFLAFYALALTVSTIFSTELLKSLQKLPGEFYLIGLAVLTFNLVRDEDFFRRATYAWLVGTCLTVIASLTGFVLFYLGFTTESENYFLSHIGSLPDGDYPRVEALFANPNMLTNFLNVSLMLAVLTSKNGWFGKIWMRILQAGIWFSAIIAFSPGLGGIFVSLGVWYWAVVRAKDRQVLSKTILTAGLSCAALVFFVTLISPDTGNTDRDFAIPYLEKKVEPSVRVLVWENALHTFKESPVVGRGTGTNAAVLQYQTLSGTNQILLDAHNVWLSVLSQAGLLGVVAFGMLVFYMASRCRFRFYDLDSRNMIHLALSCSFVGAFLFQGMSGSFEDARHLWILFGMLVAISTLPRSDTSKAS